MCVCLQLFGRASARVVAPVEHPERAVGRAGPPGAVPVGGGGRGQRRRRQPAQPAFGGQHGPHRTHRGAPVPTEHLALPRLARAAGTGVGAGPAEAIVQCREQELGGLAPLSQVSSEL